MLEVSWNVCLLEYHKKAATMESEMQQILQRLTALETQNKELLELLKPAEFKISISPKVSHPESDLEPTSPVKAPANYGSPTKPSLEPPSSGRRASTQLYNSRIILTTYPGKFPYDKL